MKIIRQTRQMTPKVQREIVSSDSSLGRVLAIRSYYNLGYDVHENYPPNTPNNAKEAKIRGHRSVF
jgi:hypothetical protein